MSYNEINIKDVVEFLPQYLSLIQTGAKTHTVNQDLYLKLEKIVLTKVLDIIDESKQDNSEVQEVIAVLVNKYCKEGNK